MTLMEYNYSITYLKGKDNAVADALSRITIEELKLITEQIENSKVLVATRSKTKQANLKNKESNPEENEQKNKTVTPGKESDQFDKPVVCEILKRNRDMIEVKALNEMKENKNLGRKKMKI
jgi:hypothetical protein